MFGICGWVGELGDPEESDRILAGMLSDCGGGEASGIPHLAGKGFRLGVLGPGAEAGTRRYLDDDLALVMSEGLLGASGRALRARDLADLYRAHGQDLLRRVRGPFAMALLDRRDRTLLVAIDRIGQRPLFFHPFREGLAFSSRLGALRRLPGFRPSIDQQALFDYLYFHVVPSPGTIYEGCDKLLPAQMLILEADGRRRGRFYWEMPYRETSEGFEALGSELRDLLPRVVKRAAGGRTDVGCFLSGGTDSSTIAGTLRQVRGGQVPTYSMGFQAEGFDELEYARIAARHFDTDPREYYVTPGDVLDSIAAVAGYCDEPFGNASIVPAYLCARYAAGDGTGCLLAGDGGDEIFGGNARYAAQWLFGLYDRVPGWMRRALIEPMAFGLPGADAIPPLRKARSYIDQAKIPLPDRLETYNFLHRTPLPEVLDRDFLAGVDPDHPLAELRAAYGRARSGSPVNRMMHLDLKITLADNDLRKVNQACGLAGVDVRYPLLDDEMMELAARVPPQMQVKRTSLRWFFKRALEDFLPQEIIQKKKHGFGLPVGVWMAEFEPLRGLAEDSLEGLGGRGILNPAYLDWLRTQHAGEHASYYGVMLWVLVMLEQWLRHHGH